jgi:RimJ/RimL family protein N-acetyltransferase
MRLELREFTPDDIGDLVRLDSDPRVLKYFNGGKPMPRSEVEANCASCHSLDYIQGNSPFMNRAVWDAEVTKMIKAYGAPISDTDAKEIADYLAKNYGQP